MTERNEIMIGNKGGDCVLLRVGVPDREGWSKAEIDVHCDGWAGSVRGSFLKGELACFAKEIRRLHKDLVGTAQIRPIEVGLALTLSGDGRGHITIHGEARNDFVSGTRLEFCMVIDQTYLKKIAESLHDADPESPRAEKF